MTVGAALSWSSQNPGTLNTKNLTTGPHMDGSGPLPGVSATATGTIELAVQPQIGIYDAAGPNVEADADLTANVNFLGSPYFTLAPSITLKAGLDFDIADGLFHGSLDVTLGTFHFPSFTIAQCPERHPGHQPGQSHRLPRDPDHLHRHQQQRQEPPDHLAPPGCGHRGLDHQWRCPDHGEAIGTDPHRPGPGLDRGRRPDHRQRRDRLRPGR